MKKIEKISGSVLMEKAQNIDLNEWTLGSFDIDEDLNRVKGVLAYVQRENAVIALVMICNQINCKLFTKRECSAGGWWSPLGVIDGALVELLQNIEQHQENKGVERVNAIIKGALDKF